MLLKYPCRFLPGRVSLLLTYITCLFLLTSCGENAVVFAPTPLPPDTSSLRYQHPSGAFTIDVPREWSSYLQNSATLASAHFTPPGAEAPLISIIAIKWDFVPSSLTLLDAVNAYQQELRPNVIHYTEQDRQLMGDESWRLTGFEITPGGSRVEQNTFIEQQESVIGITEINLNQPDLLPVIENIVNSIQINAQANLQPGSLATLANWSSSPLEINNVSTWSTSDGVYFITGEVVNRGTETLSNVPIRAVLQSTSEENSIEAVDTIMGYGIRPGEFAPFSLRFGQGSPADATTYSLTVGDEFWQQNRNPIGEIIGSEQLDWSGDLIETTEGHLLISGSVTHIGSQIAFDPVITVSIFDAQKNVIAAGFTPIAEGEFRPGETLSYNLRVPEMGGIPADYYVNIQAKTTP